MGTAQQNQDPYAAYGGKVDYSALAAKARQQNPSGKNKFEVEPPSFEVEPPNTADPYSNYGGKIDYEALAEQARQQKPKTFWERIGMVPSEDDTPPPLKPGEQAGPSLGGSPGEMLMLGLGRGAKTAGKAYVTQGPGQMLEGAGDITQGNISRGGHKVISGGMVTALPIMPEAIAANPLMAARAIAGGYVGQKVATTGAELAGANEEQKQFAGDLGNLAGGFSAASGLPRALFETAAKNAMNKVATSIASGVLDPDAVGVVSPRLAHMMKTMSRIADLTKSPPIEGTASGPVPSGEAPAPAPKSKAPEYKLPNATYLRDDMRSLSQQPPTPPAAKPNYLSGIREHEFLLKVQEELNRQGGDEQAQKEIDDWINEHDKQTPGGKAKTKTTAAQATADDEPQVPKSDAEIETLLMKSLKKYGFKYDPATGRTVKVK